MDYQTFMACCAILFILLESTQLFSIRKKLTKGSAGCLFALLGLSYMAWTIMGIVSFGFFTWFTFLIVLSIVHGLTESFQDKKKHEEITRLDAIASIVVLIVIAIKGFGGNL